MTIIEIDELCKELHDTSKSRAGEILKIIKNNLSTLPKDPAEWTSNNLPNDTGNYEYQQHVNTALIKIEHIRVLSGVEKLRSGENQKRYRFIDDLRLALTQIYDNRSLKVQNIKFVRLPEYPGL
jgi:hypothetical protein